MEQMNKTYFSGSHASIFIGDIWVDDITSWQYQIDCSSAPIYGYGDQFYSHVAGGRVMVQGSFEVNFREPNYLWAILDRNRAKGRIDPVEYDPIAERTKESSKFNMSDESFLADKRVNLDYFFNSGNAKKATASLQKDRSFKKPDADREENDFSASTFDILVGYGTSLDENSPGERVLGVKLTGKAKVIYSDGTPIKERYTFFARNVI